jgi:YVTN family beta-propeller protein
MRGWRPAFFAACTAAVLVAGVAQWIGAAEASAQVGSGTVGSEPFAVALDTATNTGYVANFGSNTVSVLDTATCNGTDQSGCTPVGTADVVSEPKDLTVDDSTNTVYVVNSGAVESSGAGVLSVINGAECDATDQTSCASVAEPVVQDSPFAVAVDAATNTIYVTNYGSNNVSVLNGATCDATNQSNCSPVATITVGSEPKGVAVDETTDTVYVANFGSNTVSVINGAACDATDQSSCTPIGTSDVKAGPKGVAVDETTDTVYVADSSSDPDGDDLGALGGSAGVFTGLVSVIDGATCGATSQSNCKPVGNAAAGYEPQQVAVDEATNTVYATNYSGISGADVSVIDGATCDATVHSGCEATWSVAAGGTDEGIAVDPSTPTQPDSVYVTNYDSNTVSTFGEPAAPTSTAVEASGPGAATVSWASSSAGQLPVDSDGPGNPGEFTYKVQPNPACSACTGLVVGDTVNSSGALVPVTQATIEGLKAGTSYSFTVLASNAAGPSPVSVAAGPVIANDLSVAPVSLADTFVGESFSESLSASGGTAPYTFAVSSGTLPPGLTLSASGVLSGKPTAAGTSSFTVGVTDSSASALSTFTPYVMSVSPAPSDAPLSPKKSPPASEGAATTYDAATNSVLAFGGRTKTGAMSSATWSWNGTTWSSKKPTTSPPGLSGASLAYDAATKTVVLFGGTTAKSQATSATWTWNGTTWTEASPATSPPVRTDAAMAYDPATKTVVLFGGTNGTTDLADTWSWNGTTWTARTPASSPPARSSSSVTYDTATKDIVLFGGSGSSGLLGDTWSWNGTTWTQLSTSGPSARAGAAADYDGDTATVVLFGGYGGCGTCSAVLDDTWTWDGSAWSELNPAAPPAGRYFAAHAFDPHTGQLLLFGGTSGSGFPTCASRCTPRSDTWTSSYGTAPSLVSGVTVSSVSDSQVSLSWTAPDSWGGSSSDEYVVSASTPNIDGVDEWTIPATSTTTTIDDLFDGVPVSFTVAAENAGAQTSGPSFQSASVSPSPTLEMTNTLTLSVAPSAKDGSPGNCAYVSSSSSECFTFQQNFYVQTENAGPGVVPGIWVQNVLFVADTSGGWVTESETNIWDLTSAGWVYWAYAQPSTTPVASFPATFTVTTAVEPDKVVFSSSSAGSDYSSWTVPSLAESIPFDVVYNPNDTSTSQNVFASPQAMLVGPGGGTSVAFGAGTAGSLTSEGVLADGSAQGGYQCPITSSFSSTGETSTNLGWTVSAPTAAFAYSHGSTLEGVAFLPQQSSCVLPSLSPAFSSLHLVKPPLMLVPPPQG